MKFKRILTSLSLGLLLFITMATFATPQAANACNRDNDQRLFSVGGNGGILPWHHYLDCDASGTGISQSIELNDLWLIAIAMFESILFIGGILSVVFIIWGGVKYITSQGSPEGTANARKTLVNAIAGLIITVSASVVVALMIDLIAPGGLNQNNALNIPGVEAERSFVEGILRFVYALMGAVALIYVVIGSIKFATSTGDPQKASSARNTIIYAIVGLIVVLMASIISGYILSRL